MCGIGGVVEFGDGRPSREGLARMGDAMIHRGPDEAGVHVQGPAGLVHRRLRILDLSALGRQPMGTADGRTWVVFNGEIYNYPELKRELEAAGESFRSRCDTEVLLALYRRRGVDAFPFLNGMFAAGFWDAETERLVLVRDRLGKKPLFYHHDGTHLIFASELKALLAYGGIERTVHPSALLEYLTYGHIAGEQTIIRGVYRLPPAHLLVAERGRVRVERYWRLTMTPSEGPPPREEEVVERLGALLEDAVAVRLASDVPLGAFLSGGLDSSTVVALMARAASGPVRTFSIGFDESSYSELEDARVVAKHLGTDHHEMVVSPSAVDLLPRLVWHLDEPFADSSAIPTFAVCHAAREHVTVALSGDGGDEVFAGYTRYRQPERTGPGLPAWLGRGLLLPSLRAAPFTMPGWNYLYALGRGSGASSLGVYPYIRDRLISPQLAAECRSQDPGAGRAALLEEAAGLDPVSRRQYVDTLHYLPADILTKVDRMSMANSLEVRSPLLDYRVVEYAATLPVSMKIRDGVAKYVLRRVAAPLLPPSVLTKRKQGFAIPKAGWFRRELRDYAAEVLLDRRTLARGYVRERAVRTMLTHHAQGGRDYSEWIWSLLVLELWHRAFIDHMLDGAHV